MGNLCFDWGKRMKNWISFIIGISAIIILLILIPKSFGLAMTAPLTAFIAGILFTNKTKQPQLLQPLNNSFTKILLI